MSGLKSLSLCSYSYNFYSRIILEILFADLESVLVLSFILELLLAELESVLALLSPLEASVILCILSPLGMIEAEGRI